MKSKFIYFVLLFIGVIFEIVGDVLFKKWANGAAKSYMYLGLFTYLAGSLVWLETLKFNDLSKTLVAFICLNVVMGVIGGVIFLGEKLSLNTYIGVVLCMVGLIFVES